MLSQFSFTFASLSYSFMFSCTLCPADSVSTISLQNMRSWIRKFRILNQNPNVQNQNFILFIIHLSLHAVKTEAIWPIKAMERRTAKATSSQRDSLSEIMIDFIFCIWCFLFCIWCFVFCIWCSIFCIWCFIFCIWCFIFCRKMAKAKINQQDYRAVIIIIDFNFVARIHV